MSDISAVLIRQIDSSDQQQLLEFLGGVNGEDRLVSCQFDPTVYERVWGAFCKDRLAGLMGVPDLESHGRVILVVAVEWRRRGIASALVQAAIASASVERNQPLRIICSRSDWPMRNFLNKTGARLDLAFDEIVARFTSGIGSKE